MIEICLPVKNEEQILAVNTLRLMTYLESVDLPDDWKIVILVNGSEDSSWQIARELAGAHAKIKAELIVAGGKGQALKTYFSKSLADILVFMDIDLAVSLDNIYDLIKPISTGACELVIGSRLIAGAHTDRSVWRGLTSRAYNWLSRFVLGHSFCDLQCGFKAVRRTVFWQLLPYLVDGEWFFDTELVISATHLKLAVREIPVDWRENRYDQRKSKVRVMRDAWSFIRNLFRLRFRLLKNTR